MATDTALSAAVVFAGGAVANTGGSITGGYIGVGLTQAGNVTNTGAIRGTAGAGIVLQQGGAVLNAGAAASVRGYSAGVSIASVGTVINQGSIAATRTAGSGYGYVSGTGFYPVIASVIVASGGISNASTGTLSSARIGAALTGLGSIQNSGVINAVGLIPPSGTVTATTTVGFGAWLFGGGSLVNAAGGTINGGFDGVMVTGTVASKVTNSGVLSGAVDSAVDFFSIAGDFTNTTTGSVTSSDVGLLERHGGTAVNAGSVNAPFGMLVLNQVGTATNSGTITGSSHGYGAGIQLRAGGTITNAAGGYIRGNWVGMQIGGFANGTTTYAPGGTVINAGTVIANDVSTGAGAAVWVKGNGIVINQATGTIAGGPYGIVSYNPITVFNHGLISGSQYAVFASNAGNHDRIVVYPQAQFSGIVQGDQKAAVTPNGVLELAGGTIAGSIAGFGSKYVGFSNVIIDAGATWSLAGTVTSSQTLTFAGTGDGLTLVNPGSFSGTITGFGTTDALVLGGITDVTATSLGPNNLLTVSETGGKSFTLQFDPNQTFTAASFGFVTGASSTTLSAPCFAQGTRIETVAGPCAVEALRAGALVPSVFGGEVVVQWIGYRRVDCAHHPRPHDVWPIRVRAGAFGPGQPVADLRLSPDHAVYVDGVLIPVRALLNGRTIVQEQVDSVTYYHVELPAHDVILAEGLACESYLDTGNRAAFANGSGAEMLHPDFARATWASAGCAPLVLEGNKLVAARDRLLRQAEALGHGRSRLPALRVEAGGKVLAARIAGHRWHVTLPAGTDLVTLRSRDWIPAHTRADESDTRRLGVAVVNIALDGHEIALADARLAEGWHGAEAEWRWTDGAALLRVDGATSLAFDLMLTGTYWEARRNDQAAHTAAAT